MPQHQKRNPLKVDNITVDLARQFAAIVGDACDTLHNPGRPFLGDPRAPSFTDAEVVEICNGFQRMLSQETSRRVPHCPDYPQHTHTKGYMLNDDLPMAIRRAMVERIWALANQNGFTNLTLVAA